MIFNLNSAHYMLDKDVKYLYRNGKMCEEFESGFNGIGQITNEANLLTFTSKYNSTYGNRSSALYSQTKINFSEYSWLYIKIDSTNGNCYIGFNSDSSMTTTAISSCMKITTTDLNSSNIFKIPLSSISNKTQAFSFGAEGATYKISKIWLAKDASQEAVEKTVTKLVFSSG